jgi:hypothetical protein
MADIPEPYRPGFGSERDVPRQGFPCMGIITPLISPPEKFLKVLDSLATLRCSSAPRMWISGSVQGNSARTTYLCPSGTQTFCLKVTNGRF